MRNILQFLLTALPFATAWPAVMEAISQQSAHVQRRDTYPTVPPPKFASNRDNCGSAGPCTTFNAADQYVDVSAGSGHEFKLPSSTDLRSEFPGLNAAANHNFLPRSGILTTQQTIDGLSAAYSMSTDLALVLAIIAIAISGDPIAGKWSIGGAFPGTLGLLGKLRGILGTHNRYEGDASNGDAYLHNGNVDYFEMHKWERLYALATQPGGLTHGAASQAYYNHEFSVQNNPYYFSAPFSGLVAPAAHNFVVNFMSNHSAEFPGGYLNGEILKSFFSVTGTPGKFLFNRGQERIPANWYKRPSSNPVTTASTNIDTVINNLMYPGTISFGWNTGTVNSFVGVDTRDLTSGVYNADTLLRGNNLSCFLLQGTQAGLVDALSPLLDSVGAIASFLSKNLGPQLAGLNCPQLSSFKNEFVHTFPRCFLQGTRPVSVRLILGRVLEEKK